MPSSADRRVALVTGSSRGLGAGIARHLADLGFSVAVNGTSEAEVESVAAAIRDADGRARPYVADITDPDDVTALVAAIEGDVGPIDVLVLNATGPQPEAPVPDVQWSDYLHQLDFFVKSPVLLGARVIPGMVAREWGRIINIDSEVAHAPPPGRSAYATAKNAQIGLTKAWARELAPHGITVNTIAPGFVPVERHAHLGDEIAEYVHTVPTGRMGTREDVANAVGFFAGEGSGFITGQRLIVDGGRSLFG